MEEVDFVGGGVFFGGSVFFVGGGDVCFWSRVALTGHRKLTTLYAANEANYLSTEVLKYYFGT